MESRLLAKPKRAKMTLTLSQSDDDNLVYIGRAWNLGGYHLKQSTWKNPFPIKQCDNNREMCCIVYYLYLHDQDALLELLPSLAGKTLLCFCKPGELCHADIIIMIGEELELW